MPRGSPFEWGIVSNEEPLDPHIFDSLCTPEKGAKGGEGRAEGPRVLSGTSAYVEPTDPVKPQREARGPAKALIADSQFPTSRRFLNHHSHVCSLRRREILELRDSSRTTQFLGCVCKGGVDAVGVACVRERGPAKS